MMKNEPVLEVVVLIDKALEEFVTHRDASGVVTLHAARVVASETKRQRDALLVALKKFMDGSFDVGIGGNPIVVDKFLQGVNDLIAECESGDAA
jgi:hypothetical protein